MLQLRDRPRLAREPSYGLVIVRVFRADDLDRDLAAELAVARAIHDRGRAAAKLAQNLVIALEIGCRDVGFGIAKHQPARKINLIGTPSDRRGTAITVNALPFAKDERDFAHLYAVAFRQHDRRHRSTLWIE